MLEVYSSCCIFVCVYNKFVICVKGKLKIAAFYGSGERIKVAGKNRCITAEMGSVRTSVCILVLDMELIYDINCF